MKITPVTEIKAHFSSYLKDCQEEPIVITENGKPIAALIAVVDKTMEELLLAKNENLNEILTLAETRIKNNEGISHEDFWDVDEL